jgi:hypothetical protein
MTVRRSKPISSIAVIDLLANPVWQFVTEDSPDETSDRPVTGIPVDSVAGSVVGTQVRLANGSQVWALIGNVDLRSARLTEHFLTLSVETGGTWFNLARYFDADYAERGPEALAQFLNLPVDQVFPIAYDIRAYAQGDQEALCGLVSQEPRERLSRAEIIAMAVP